MKHSDIKRWSKISLRTLHLLSVAGVGGGVLFALDKTLWVNYWWLALVSGVLLMLIDVIANPVWLIQIRGLVIYVKIIALALMDGHAVWDPILLILIIIISAVVSHAPGNVRYYSLYHRRVIESTRDSKG
jgi:hypothetical protein